MTDNPRSENDITGVIEPTFSTEDESFGEVQTIDLKPDGRNIEVTNENKKEYIESVSSYRTLEMPNLVKVCFCLPVVDLSPNGGFRSAWKSNSTLL